MAAYNMLSIGQYSKPFMSDVILNRWSDQVLDSRGGGGEEDREVEKVLFDQVEYMQNGELSSSLSCREPLKTWKGRLL